MACELPPQVPKVRFDRAGAIGSWNPALRNFLHRASRLTRQLSVPYATLGGRCLDSNPRRRWGWFVFERRNIRRLRDAQNSVLHGVQQPCKRIVQRDNWLPRNEEMGARVQDHGIGSLRQGGTLPRQDQKYCQS